MLFSFAELAGYTGGEWIVAPGEGGVDRISTDSRTIGAGDLFLALAGENFDGHDYIAKAVDAGAVALIVSKPVDTSVPALLVADTLTAYQQLAKSHRLRFEDLFVVGITGSCGKTSSKEIISSVLRAHFGADAVLTTEGNTNNQIGVPQNLLRLTAEHKAAVLEMGTNMHGEIGILTRLVMPNVAVITNVGPVHLEGLGDLDGVAREKSSIFQGLQTDGLAILSTELAANPIVQPNLPQNVTTVGFDAAATVRIEYLGGDLTSARFRATTDAGRDLDVSWSLRGRHMAANAAAAIAIADHLGIDDATVLAGLQSCQVPGMRMAISEIGGVTWINDAYNANPESMKALINWLADAPAPDGKLVLVLGDMLELGPTAPALHKEVLTHAKEVLPNAVVYAFGPIMTSVATTPVQAFDDMDALQHAVTGTLAAGDCIALKGSRGMRLERLLPAAE